VNSSRGAPIVVRHDPPAWSAPSSSAAAPDERRASRHARLRSWAPPPSSARPAASWRGLDHEDSARFAFLLATTVILAAGMLKIRFCTPFAGYCVIAGLAGIIASPSVDRTVSCARRL
jgi:hypothetical protein